MVHMLTSTGIGAVETDRQHTKALDSDALCLLAVISMISTGEGERFCDMYVALIP